MPYSTYPESIWRLLREGDDFNHAFCALARHLGEGRERIVLQRKRRWQNMIDHMILTVSDFQRSVGFYTKALKPLEITNFIDYEGQDGHPDLKGFGDGKRAFFWLKEGKPDPQAVHVGFVAKDHAEVNAFYKAAVDAGGKSKEAPQARLEYYPGYYATWVLDPDGHDIEVVHKS